MDVLYKEIYRPQFHYTAPRGFLGDPEMTVYDGREYHLGYIGCETVAQEGPTCWGHAVSPDLLHWRELPHAVEPDPGHERGAWSGGAVVDWKNTSVLRTGSAELLVAFYTKTHHGICLVYSNDRGRTWTKFAGNPVLLNSVTGTWDDRDPTVFWHAPSGRWVMVLSESGLTRISFYGSADLKSWERLSSLDRFHEADAVVDCPDLFQMPVDGDPNRLRWVLYSSFFDPLTGRYVLGDFNGAAFRQEDAIRRVEWSNTAFAARTWRETPDGRVIQIAFLRSNERRWPGMPFGNQMTFPCELSLRTFPEGVRLCAEPVREIERLRTLRHTEGDCVVSNKPLTLPDIPGGLMDIEAEFELRDAAEFGLNIHGEPVQYIVLDQQIQTCGFSGPLAPVDGRIRLRALVDRISLEVFGNDGRLTMSNYFPERREAKRGVEVYARRGSVRLAALRLYELAAAW